MKPSRLFKMGWREFEQKMEKLSREDLEIALCYAHGWIHGIEELMKKKS